jgi:hypothetical protein
VPSINEVLAWPISDWSRSASPSMTTNATTDVQKPKLMNLPRTRRAGEAAPMELLWLNSRLSETGTPERAFPGRSELRATAHSSLPPSTAVCLTPRGRARTGQTFYPEVIPFNCCSISSAHLFVPTLTPGRQRRRRSTGHSRNHFLQAMLSRSAHSGRPGCAPGVVSK